MKKNKNLILTLMFSIITTICFADFYEPRGSYYPGEENYGLLSLDTSIKALILGLVLFCLGLILSKTKNEKTGDTGPIIGGCFSVLSMFCVMPILAWLQYIGVLIAIAFGLVIIILFVTKSIWEKIKKNN